MDALLKEVEDRIHGYREVILDLQTENKMLKDRIKELEGEADEQKNDSTED